MEAEKPIEIKTDWNDALKGLGYTCGVLSMGLVSVIEGVSLVAKGEHIDLKMATVAGVGGILYGALLWADTYSLKEEEVYKNWPYNLVEQPREEATLFQLQQNT